MTENQTTNNAAAGGQPYPDAPGGYPAQQQAGNGMAIASLVLGIVGLLIFGPILGILALVFGGIGLSRANKGAKYKGMAIAGLVLGVLDIVLVVVLLIANHGSYHYHIG